MTGHARALELAIAGLDFGLTAEERGELAAHLAGCPACAESLAAMQADADRLAAGPELRAPARVREAVVAAALDERATSVLRRPQMVIAIALLAVVLVGATVAVGAKVLEWLEQSRLPTPVVTPQPSSTGAPSATPAATPDLVFVLPDGTVPPGAWATVTSGPLPLYLWPWYDSESTTQLANEARVHVPDVPVVVDGHQWVLVRTDQGADGYAALPELLNAITLDPVTCPAAADLATVVSLSAWERLSCYGGRELSLEGSEIVGFSELLRPADPDWLNGHGALVITPGAGLATLPVHVAPDTVAVERPAFDTELAPYAIRVTGHFNDPASFDCRGPQRTLDPDDRKRLVDADLTGAELLCREQFVLTGLEVLGATPAPTPAPAQEVALLRVDITPDVSGPWPGTDFVLFDDGRLVTMSRTGSGWIERRLASAARDELMRGALADPLLQTSVAYPPDPGWAAGFVGTVITLQRESGVVRVSATNASGGDAAARVVALGESLSARVRALPDSAFVESAHTWLPSTYNMTIDLSPGVLDTYPTPPEFIGWADDLALPLSTPLIETGEVIRSEGGTATRCAVIDSTLASRLRAAFQAAGYPRTWESLVAAGYDLGWRATNGTVGVTIYAVSPNERSDYHCASEGG